MTQIKIILIGFVFTCAGLSKSPDWRVDDDKSFAFSTIITLLKVETKIPKSSIFSPANPSEVMLNNIVLSIQRTPAPRLVDGKLNYSSINDKRVTQLTYFLVHGESLEGTDLIAGYFTEAEVALAQRQICLQMQLIANQKTLKNISLNTNFQDSPFLPSEVGAIRFTIMHPSIASGRIALEQRMLQMLRGDRQTINAWSERFLLDSAWPAKRKQFMEALRHGQQASAYDWLFRPFDHNLLSPAP